LPPLLSTLFPYTTLFRSVVDPRISIDRGDDAQREGDDESDGHRSERELNCRRITLGNLFAHRFIRLKRAPEIAADHVRDVRDVLDRKSTRLNSSHVAISY